MVHGSSQVGLREYATISKHTLPRCVQVPCVPIDLSQDFSRELGCPNCFSGVTPHGSFSKHYGMAAAGLLEAVVTADGKSANRKLLHQFGSVLGSERRRRRHFRRGQQINPARAVLGWVNWRCLRTSYGTWQHEAGVNMKDIQGNMRHSRMGTTADIYVQDIPASRRRAVDSLPVPGRVN